MKRFPFVLGVVCFIVSIIGFASLYEQTKININTLTPQEIQYVCDRTSTIGDQTAKALSENVPFSSIASVDSIKGIGPAKLNAIFSRFDTRDVYRWDVFFWALMGTSILSIIGSCIISYVIIKKSILSSMVAKELKEKGGIGCKQK